MCAAKQKTERASYIILKGQRFQFSNYNLFLYLKIVSLFKLVSVAEETGLNLSLSETFLSGQHVTMLLIWVVADKF